MTRLVPQERVQWIDEQVVEVLSGKEEFLTKLVEVRTQLDEMSKNIQALLVQKSGVLDHIGDRIAESGGGGGRFVAKQIGVLMEERQRKPRQPQNLNPD